MKFVATKIVRRETRVLDFDLRAHIDNVRHDRLLAKVAQRIADRESITRRYMRRNGATRRATSMKRAV
jgi:retron-type reverse transcriptase